MFQNVGTYNAKPISSQSLNLSGANNGMFTMDAAGIASGGAFLVSELEKKDPLIRKPLTAVTYPRDININVGGWVDYVSAMSVAYGLTGGSENGPVQAGGANGLPIVQASVDKGVYDANVYVGLSDYDTTGLVNNPDATETTVADGAAGTATWATKTPLEILADINSAITAVWAAAEYDTEAMPNHILIPYEQYTYIMNTPVTDLATETILDFVLKNNVAAKNGGSLFVGATRWCKGAGTGSKDRMVVYVNHERYVNVDELVPLTRAMTQPNAANVCYDTAYMANLSEVQLFYPQTIAYFDGI